MPPPRKIEHTRTPMRLKRASGCAAKVSTRLADSSRSDSDVLARIAGRSPSSSRIVVSLVRPHLLLPPSYTHHTGTTQPPGALQACGASSSTFPPRHGHRRTPWASGMAARAPFHAAPPRSLPRPSTSPPGYHLGPARFQSVWGINLDVCFRSTARHPFALGAPDRARALFPSPPPAPPPLPLPTPRHLNYDARVRSPLQTPPPAGTGAHGTAT